MYTSTNTHTYIVQMFVGRCVSMQGHLSACLCPGMYSCLSACSINRQARTSQVKCRGNYLWSCYWYLTAELLNINSRCFPSWLRAREQQGQNYYISVECQSIKKINKKIPPEDHLCRWHVYETTQRSGETRESADLLVKKLSKQCCLTSGVSVKADL